MGKMTLSQMVAQLAGGMGTSIQIFVVTLVFSLPLGLIVAFGRMTKNGFLRNLVKVYISIMRGTPLMLQLMVVYFGPYYLFGIRVGSGYRLWATFIGFVINYAAYFAEIYRSGIQSMPQGQYEAAYILGYSRFQTFFKIILPLSLSGVFSGIIMVFVPALTSFVISDLLGGGKVLLIGNVIEQEFMQGSNWNLGSGLSVVLMIFVIASMAVMNIFDKDQGGTAVW